jgi:hypothetical protein
MDLGFCNKCIIVMVDPCKFTQQLEEYIRVKPKARLKITSILGAKCIMVYPNLFTLQEQEVAKLLLIIELYND